MDQVGIQSVKGFTPSAAEHSKFVAEARTPYDLDDIRQFGWKLVDKQRLLLADWMRNTIPAIQMAKRIDGEALKHGGISLRIGQGKPQRKRTNDLFAKTILNWAARIDSDQDTFGFAVAMTAEPQPGIKQLFNRDYDSFSDVGQQIFAVPVTQVDVYHKQNLLGEHLWVVCKPPDMLTGGQMRPVPLPGCFVFWRTPPDVNGEPQSIVLSLLPAYQFVEEMKVCALQAARKRAAPPLVTERVESKQDPQLEGILPLPGQCDTKATTEVEEITMKDRLMDRMVRLENTLNSDQLGMVKQFSSVLGMAAKQIQQEMVLGERLDLPAERKLVRQLQAEAPGMELQKLQIHFEQIVLMAFGIPPGEIQPESTHGKMVSNDNIREVFNTHLSHKKQELVLAMEVMLRHVYRAGIALRYALKYKPSLVETIKQNSVIRVELPSIPEEKQMMQYYELGMLKWEALREYLSTKHVIPLESFEDKPQLTQMDLLTNGKPPELSAAKKKKPTKKKKRAAPSQ